MKRKFIKNTLFMILIFILQFPLVVFAAVTYSSATNPLTTAGASSSYQPGENEIPIDIDSDGDIDFIGYDTSDVLRLYRNNGSGVYTQESLGFTPTVANLYRIIVADIDNDGDDDILDSDNVYRRNDAGTLVSATNPLTTAGASADYLPGENEIPIDIDSDGDIDFIGYDTSNTLLRLYRNNGSGVFTEESLGFNPTLTNMYNFIIADIDNDGDDDVIDSDNVYHRNDAGTLVSATNPLTTAGVSSSYQPGENEIPIDIDSDGDIDFIGFDTSDVLRLYRNNGSGVFTQESLGFAPTISNMYNYIIADIDNDGDDDVLDSDNVFQQASGKPPELISTLPTDNATSVDVNTNIVLTFDEIISSTDIGTFNIYKTTDDSLVESIAGNSVKVSGVGTVAITINPDTTLDATTEYYFQINKKAFFDSDGSTYNHRSVLDKTSHSFTTGSSNTAPVLGGTFNTSGAINDNTTIAPFSSVTVSDADADNVSVSITYTSANGTLSGTGITGSAGNYTVTSAAPATATSNLQGIVFTPTANQVAPGSTVVTSFTLTPNDGTTNGTANATTQVTATSINDAPVITSNGGGSTASTSINENTTAVTTVTSTDADTGETYSYSISGGADSALFSINSSSGALAFTSAPNYESPADSGANNVYDVQVRVTDSGTGNLTDTQDIAVTVGNINENPVITNDGGGATASINAAENQIAVTTVTATDQDTGDTLTYSITGGADQAQFSINSSSGVLTFASPPNYESPTDSGANNVYDVQVTVTDNGAGTLTDVQAIAVTVTNANEAPVITSNGNGSTASTSINENNTAVTTVTATDVDTSDTLTYSISGGADQALFSINSSTGALVFASAPNYESPADSGANNVYDVQVMVTDSGTGNLTDTQDIAVTVGNINENPVITNDGGGATASINAAENQTAVTTVTATDQDTGDTLTYSISGGPDQALFSINSSTGVLTFASPPNYESPTDSGANNVYDVQVTVTDNGAGTLTDVQAIAVTVTNANEAPVITSNGNGSTASTSINENNTAVTAVTATDVDSSDTLTYSISGGADQALFSINSSTGALVFTSAPNYESPADSGGNNVYDVQVMVTDSGTGNLTDTQDIAVTVGNINENPVITNDGGGATANINAAENQTAVTTVTATDQDTGDTLTYSITGGADSASFSINSSSGVLTFASPPNYESPTDSGANNVYDVQVTVTDDGTGTLTDVQAIAVTVTNANEAPVITSDGGGASASVSAAENQTAVTTVTATDVDAGNTLSYSITGGADQAAFSINSSSGVLAFNTAPNYESPGDNGADNVYDVLVTVTDSGTGNLTDVQAIAVSVTNVNEVPALTDLAGDTLNYYTNEGARVIDQGGDAAVTDVDSVNFDGGALTVSIVSNGVNAEDRLSVNGGVSIGSVSGGSGGNPLVITFNSSADLSSINSLLRAVTYENLNTSTVTESTRTVRFTITDGDGGTSAAVDTSVIVVQNTAPTIGGTPATGVGDDVAYSFTPTSSDAQGDTLTFSIVNKPSWASFSTTTGALTGTPTSSDIGTTSGIVISVSDGLLESSLSAFSIEVYADLDNDNIPDTTDPDIDGDGMSNDYEDANGLDKLDASDRDTDLDGDGVSNYDEFLASTDASADDYPPEVTAPPTIDVDATGLFTEVTLGSATAIDGKDGTVNATVTSIQSNSKAVKALTSNPTHFSPGVHILTWSATDTAGNTGTAQQIVNVTPLVEFSKDQTSSEGSSASFKVILNGPPVSYPVLVPYTVGGTAATDGSDHNLSDGSVTINSPDLEATISVDLIDDGAGEGNETMVVSLATPSNAVPGAHASHTLTIAEGNVAPQLDISAVQGTAAVRVVEQTGGNVVVTASASDANGDALSYDWSASSNALIDTDSVDNSFTLDPSNLTPGAYRAVVSVSDGTETVTARIDLSVIATPPVLDTNDSDGDGVDDASEGNGDSDGDGIVDYLDHVDIARNVVQETMAVADEYLMEAEPGVRLTLGQVAFLAGANATAVADNDISTYGNDSAGAALDIGFGYNGGVFDFEVAELPRAGQSVSIVLAQFAAIPADAVYRKLMPSGWQEFIIDADNSIASAAGSEGYCPPPGDSAYSDGLTPGHWCVQLTIEDGGPNDADGAVNQHISDPGGVAIVTSVPVTVSVNGSGNLNCWDIALLLLLLGIRLPRHQHIRLGILAAGLIAVGNAQAASLLMPDYVGFNLLSVHSDERSRDFQEELDKLALNATVTQSDLDRNGWSIHAGYRIDANFAAELGYVDLGDVKTTITGQAVDVNTFITDIKDVYPTTASGLTVDLVGILPIKPGLEVQFRGGLFKWKEDYTLRGSGVARSFSDSGWSFRLGAALEMAFDEHWAGRAGLKLYNFSGAHVNTWDIGAVYRY